MEGLQRLPVCGQVAHSSQRKRQKWCQELHLLGDSGLVGSGTQLQVLGPQTVPLVNLEPGAGTWGVGAASVACLFAASSEIALVQAGSALSPLLPPSPLCLLLLRAESEGTVLTHSSAWEQPGEGSERRGGIYGLIYSGEF